METPPFLEHLGLTEAVSDEREIKRAYARLVKQIDQEADPAGFQRLRLAYEAALQWLTRPRRVVLPASSTDEFSEKIPAADTVDRPHAAAHAVFTEYFTKPCENETEAAQRLASSLNDSRLLHIEARTLFEALVAHALVSDRISNISYLLYPASNVFGWDHDHRRLSRLGSLNPLAERKLSERIHARRIQESQRYAYTGFSSNRKTDVERVSKTESPPEIAQWSGGNLKWGSNSYLSMKVRFQNGSVSQVDGGLPKVDTANKPEKARTNKAALAAFLLVAALFIVGVLTKAIDSTPPNHSVAPQASPAEVVHGHSTVS
jgi:hypothetical protein